LLLATLLILATAQNSPAQQGDAQALLEQGDLYAAAGKAIEARDAYERAIASGASLENDWKRAHALGLSYKNAEPHDYAKASRWLEAALRLKQDDETRLHLAQALSWDAQYAASIAQYEILVRSKPEDRALKIQLARVLSWSGNLSGALAVYDDLQKRFPDDVEALTERARVLSWDGRYDEATQTYGEILKREPDNAGAQLGQAQILYWSGRTEAAMVLTREVLRREPTNGDASFLMAALEHSRGQDARALQWLKTAHPGKDTTELRNLISRELRPTLHLQFGFGNDREQPALGPGSTYRTLRYNGTIGFNLTHNLRMEVANAVTQNAAGAPILARFGRDSLATQTLARLHFSAAPWLRMSLGAGEGTSGAGAVQSSTANRRHHFLYEVHPVVIHKGLRLDVTSVRSIADYTPLAVHGNLVQRRDAAAASYTFGKRVRVGAEYWRGAYRLETPDLREFSTHAQGGSGSLYPILFSGESFALEAGIRYDIFEFADKTATLLDPALGLESSGIFMPRLYQRYSGAAYVRMSPHKRLRLELNGSYGPQRVFGFPSLAPPPPDFGNTGSAGVRLTIPSARLEPYVSWDYFSTDTPASPGLRQGAFSSHFLTVGLRHRF
jgi:tetratricopeptide (TPR) repeat protein